MCTAWQSGLQVPQVEILAKGLSIVALCWSGANPLTDAQLLLYTVFHLKYNRMAPFVEIDPRPFFCNTPKAQLKPHPHAVPKYCLCKEFAAAIKGWNHQNRNTIQSNWSNELRSSAWNLKRLCSLSTVSWSPTHAINCSSLSFCCISGESSLAVKATLWLSDCYLHNLL